MLFVKIKTAAIKTAAGILPAAVLQITV